MTRSSSRAPRPATMGLLPLLLLSVTLLLAACDAAAQDDFARPPPHGATFVASSRGRVYYPVGCDAWHDLASRNLRFFETEAEARAAGYRRTRSGRCTAALPLAELLQPPVPAGARPAGTDPPPRLPAGVRVAGVCVVEDVVDGDTVRCRSGARIRLLLIDAPESGQSDFGLRSRLALEELLPPGASAAVELDVQERDRYGRILAHLYAQDGTHVILDLVRRGYAVPLVYPPNVRYVDVFRAAADSARRERRGLWELSGFECLPVDFRARRCGR